MGVLTELPPEHLATLHYHFLITVQTLSSARQPQLWCHSGIYQWEPGDTRQEAFNQIFDWTLKQNGLEKGEAAILFFTLSPNVF